MIRVRIVRARPRAAFRHAARAYEERCERNLTEYTPVPPAMQGAEYRVGCDDPKEVLTRVCLMPDDEVEPNYEATRLATRRLVAMNVTELRIIRQLTQAELARRSAVTERELEDVEAGTGEMLIDTLSSLAEGLNVDVALLFRDRTDDVH